MIDMGLYNNLVIVYILFVFFYIYKYSNNGTLYIFTPFLIYVSFIIEDLIPMYMPHVRSIPPVMYRNNIIAMIMNTIFILYYNKIYQLKATFTIPMSSYISVKGKRYRMVFICLLVLLISGLLSGTFIGFLKGQDMEDARRTGEIGIGFIRDLPELMLRIIGIVILLGSYRKYPIIAGLLCFAIGMFEVIISGGNRAALLAWVVVFLVYFGIVYRGLKWWEYIFYLIAFNIVGLILGLLRRGLGVDNAFDEFSIAHGFSGNQNIFYENSIALVDLTHGRNFFYGEELYSNLVYFIPRFLWPDKPVSFGYKLKELAGYDFDGGGIGATLIENMYINWGNFWVLNYFIWIWFVHKLYTSFLKSNSYYTKTILMILLITGGREINIIRYGEILIFSLFILKFYYKKRKVI